MSDINKAINKISYYDDPKIWRELRKKPISVPMEPAKEDIKPEIEKEMDEAKKEISRPMPKSIIHKRKMKEYSSLAINLYKEAAEALEGGLAEKMDIDAKDVDKKELEMGKDVEKEHTDDIKIRKQIALDHLSEDKIYYSHLKDMEEKAKEEGTFNDEVEKFLKD